MNLYSPFLADKTSPNNVFLVSALYLPSPQNTSNYARADFSQLSLQSLTEFTVTIWVKPDLAPDLVCPFSYSTSEDASEPNVLDVWFDSNFIELRVKNGLELMSVKCK